MPQELAQVKSGEIFKIQQDLTPVKSFEGKKLSSFKKEFPEDLNKSLEIMIARLALSVNVKYNIEPYQAEDIARAIYKKYYFYSIEEIAIVFRMGGEGELISRDPETKATIGKIFDRLSKDTIFDWFKIYDERIREPLVNNVRARQHNEFERQNIETYANLGGDEGIKRILERFDKQDEDMKREEEKIKAYQTDPEAKKRNLELLKKLNGE